MLHKLVQAITFAGLAVLAAACGFPEHMHVRAGIDPRNQDDDVRFRTIYYFRTFDTCYEVTVPSDIDVASRVTGLPIYTKTAGPFQLQNDSLYRFKMTGKANPLFSSVHFEAGSLRASEIDPFGANVELDEHSNRFRYVSREEMEFRAKQNAIYDEIKRLINWSEKLGGKYATANPELRQKLQDRIGKLFEQLNALGGMTSSGSSDASKGGKLVDCPPGTLSRKGFQILGPEGWRTFNQDERLLLAMSISGKPLISAMKELANRVLNEQPNTTGKLLTLAKERIKISDAKTALTGLERDVATASADKDKKAPSVSDIVDNVLSAFENGEGGK